MKAVNVTIVSILFQAGIYAMPLGLSKPRQDYSTIFYQDLSGKIKKKRERREEGERKVRRNASSLEGGDQSCAFVYCRILRSVFAGPRICERMNTVQVRAAASLGAALEGHWSGLGTAESPRWD